MFDDARVGELLEEVLESDSTPDQVCIECPELLPEVRRRWEDCRQVEVALEALFPSSVPNHHGDVGLTRPWAELPHIPGHEVEAVLGRGGVGVVYKARHIRLGRPVAIKMLLSGAYASRTELARFLQEARAVAALRHPHVVQVYDVGECDGLPFYSMEFLEGGSLAERLGGIPQPARRASAMLATLADAVHAAHQSGVIHRDLKPGNVLLTGDGSPKVSDFGLARPIERASEHDALTIGGGRIGTPSYMAPEQASGQHGAVGPATDVYALGAILYEMLTGRPPFRGESAADTERQLLSEEPVRPSRLNARVPRDLETICLTCLQKESCRRYGTAAELRDDLLRFARNEPIYARRANWLECGSKWARRRPAAATALVASLLLVSLVTAVLLRAHTLDSQRRGTLETDLKELADLESWQHWSDARATMQRARARLDGGGPADLRARLDTVQRDLDLVDRLNAIHLSRITSGGLPLYRFKAVRDYQNAFQQAGLTRGGEPLETAVGRINASAIHPALVAAVDDWALCTIVDHPGDHRLLRVASQIDPAAAADEPIRTMAGAPDPLDMGQATRKVNIAGCSVSALLLLGERLTLIGRDPEGFLHRVQIEHPADFWANLAYGDALLRESPERAGTYYRAVLAARPEAAVGYCDLADALMATGSLDQAVDYFHRALAIEPRLARAEAELGRALRLLGRSTEADACTVRALQIDPDYAWAHYDLAYTLMAQNKLDAAIEQFRFIIAASPLSPDVQTAYRSLMLKLGRGPQAWAEWKQGLDARTLTGYDAWNGYAELSLYLGHVDEYRRARGELLRQFGYFVKSRLVEPIARSCLLLPDTGDDTRRAIAMVDKIAVSDLGTPYYEFTAFVHGLAEYRDGHDAAAIQIMTGPAAHALGPCPGLVRAMALMDEGNAAAARSALSLAITSFDWTASRADHRDLWIYHILRREAEEKVLHNLSAFLAGQYLPQTNDERLSMLGACQASGRYTSYAQLYADACAADPTLPLHGPPSLRRWAAGAASLAASGQAVDGQTLTPSGKNKLREQALQWLTAEMKQRVGRCDWNNRESCLKLRAAFVIWQSEADLASLREPAELARFSAGERSTCQAFWQSLQATIDRLNDAG